MPTPFASAISAAVGTIRQVAGVPVTYQRGADSVPITATPGGTLYEAENGTGVATWGRTKDYIFAAADLVVGGTQVTPERGDLIKETINGRVHVWTATGGSTEQFWRYSDSAQTTIRMSVRLKEIQEG